MTKPKDQYDEMRAFQQELIRLDYNHDVLEKRINIVASGIVFTIVLLTILSVTLGVLIFT